MLFTVHFQANILKGTTENRLLVLDKRWRAHYTVFLHLIHVGEIKIAMHGIAFMKWATSNKISIGYL